MTVYRVHASLMNLFLLILIGSVVAIPFNELRNPPKGYKFTPSSSNPINVHLVCHSHDDVGWLKTVDQYATGVRNDIQTGDVGGVLDSLIGQLALNPNRKFIFVEIAFFSRWYNEQSDIVKTLVKTLVRNRQMEFINGGWSMNDEATSHYRGIIDNMHLGHNWLLDTFGDIAIPKVGWHIDPFGHANAQAGLMALMGFTGFFFGRIDYEDKQKRAAESSLEFIWQGSESLGVDSNIFTGVLFNGYSPPMDFCWDSIKCDYGAKKNAPIQDDPSLFDFNADERALAFTLAMHDQADHYRTNNIMVTMGEDFTYQGSESWFVNIDKLIKYINARTETYGLNLFYSTPSIYVEYKNAAGIKWPSKTDDFFPYRDTPHASWTGFFTSRPTLKRWAYMASSMLNAITQLDVFIGAKSLGEFSSLEKAVSVCEHHDGITGTEKQHVADDYSYRIYKGFESAATLFIDSISVAIGLNQSSYSLENVCPRLNETDCNVSAMVLPDSWLAVVVYNPLTFYTNQLLSIPLNYQPSFVYDSKLQKIPFQTHKTNSFDNLQVENPNIASYSTYINTDVPPLGYSTYFILTNATKMNIEAKNDSPILENKYLKVEFSKDGLLKSVLNKASKISTVISQDWLYYTSSVGNEESSQPSGAYIFRPNGTFHVSSTSIAFSMESGPVFEAIHQTFSSWLTQTIRLGLNDDFIEFEYTIGAIPSVDEIGKEVFTRFGSDLKSNKVFYTDSVGREMQKRVRDKRNTWNLTVTEPIADNYYPINSAIKVCDGDDGRCLGLLVDRAQGGSSLFDGSFEVMVHRRLFHDDYRGVAEPLNELGKSGNGLVVRGVLRMLFDIIDHFPEKQRRVEQQILSPILPAFIPLPKKPDIIKNNWRQSFATNPLESTDLQLTTLRKENSDIIVRVSNQRSISENGKRIQFNMYSLFPKNFLEYYKLEEYSLTGIIKKNMLVPLKWDSTLHHNAKSSLSDTGFSISLEPMEIKTYKLVATKHSVAYLKTLAIVIGTCAGGLVLIFFGIFCYRKMRKTTNSDSYVAVNS